MEQWTKNRDRKKKKKVSCNNNSHHRCRVCSGIHNNLWCFSASMIFFIQPLCLFLSFQSTMLEQCAICVFISNKFVYISLQQYILQLSQLLLVSSLVVSCKVNTSIWCQYFQFIYTRVCGKPTSSASFIVVHLILLHFGEWEPFASPERKIRKMCSLAFLRCRFVNCVYVFGIRDRQSKSILFRFEIPIRSLNNFFFSIHLCLSHIGLLSIRNQQEERLEHCSFRRFEAIHTFR